MVLPLFFSAVAIVTGDRSGFEIDRKSLDQNVQIAMHLLGITIDCRFSRRPLNKLFCPARGVTSLSRQEDQ